MHVNQINSAGLKALLQIKATPGALYRLCVYNNKNAAQFIQLYDKKTTPGVGDKPVIVLNVATVAHAILDFSQLSRTFNNGIFVGNSSTADSYTAGAEDCIFDALYI